AAAGALLAVAACGGDGDSLPQSELPAFDGAISVDFNRSLGEISDAVVVVSNLDNDAVQSGAAAVGEVETGDVAQAIARLCRVERRTEGADSPSAAQLLVDSVRRLVEVDLSLTILGDDEDQCSGLPRVVDAWSVGDAASETSGAQAVALTLGAFMSGGVQSAVYDGPLADDAEVWYALKAFGNYDDRGGGFRGVALDASTTLSGLVAFAAVDWATLRIVVVNTRTADDSTVLVDLSGAEALREPTIFTYVGGGSSGFVESPSIGGSSLVAMPASSISVIEVVLRDVWRVDSDRDVDGGEVAAPAPEQADGRAGDGATPTLPPVFDPPVESADDGSALLPMPPVDDDAPIAAPADDTAGTSTSAGSGRRRAPTNTGSSGTSGGTDGSSGGTDGGSGGTSDGSDGGSSPPVAAPPATISAGGSPTATTEPDATTTTTEPDTPTTTVEPPVVTTTTTTEPPVTATTTTTTTTTTEPPPVTDPPVTDPPVTDPPVTDPPVTDPPVTDPPVTDPPVTDPPVTDPPVTDPPVTDPPDDPPPITLPPIPLPPPF
ncbi:MAG: hypothetical protein AAF945_19885, partial [Actinomycetota bacterium]